jgi:hypothetical protein
MELCLPKLTYWHSFNKRQALYAKRLMFSAGIQFSRQLLLSLHKLLQMQLLLLELKDMPQDLPLAIQVAMQLEWHKVNLLAT